MKVCFKCRQKGHFASECTQEFITLKQCTKCTGKNHSEQDCWKNKNQQKCQLCDSTEHTAKNCPTIASKLENDKVCQICDIKGHDGNNGSYYNGNNNGYNNNYTNGYNNGNNMGNNNGNMVGNKYADNRKDGSIRGCDFCKGDDHIEMNCVKKKFQQRVQGNLQPSL
ncbi:C-module-binding factor A-like [Aphidius gifuensis]|uniref:C-module-binding factor A-like n=1 Tax=Aphidius gifuensis TaxID=684658 RepID=UPI001CDC1A15|nr:C-module-binding factor A-like [Aphidius gifuensis]